MSKSRGKKLNPSNMKRTTLDEWIDEKTTYTLANEYGQEQTVSIPLFTRGNLADFTNQLRQKSLTLETTAGNALHRLAIEATRKNEESEVMEEEKEGIFSSIRDSFISRTNPLPSAPAAEQKPYVDYQQQAPEASNISDTYTSAQGYLIQDASLHEFVSVVYNSLDSDEDRARMLSDFNSHGESSLSICLMNSTQENPIYMGDNKFLPDSVKEFEYEEKREIAVSSTEKTNRNTYIHYLALTYQNLNAWTSAFDILGKRAFFTSNQQTNLFNETPFHCLLNSSNVPNEMTLTNLNTQPQIEFLMLTLQPIMKNLYTIQNTNGLNLEMLFAKHHVELYSKFIGLFLSIISPDSMREDRINISQLSNADEESLMILNQVQTDNKRNLALHYLACNENTHDNDFMLRLLCYPEEQRGNILLQKNHKGISTLEILILTKTSTLIKKVLEFIDPNSLYQFEKEVVAKKKSRLFNEGSQISRDTWNRIRSNRTLLIDIWEYMKLRYNSTKRNVYIFWGITDSDAENRKTFFFNAVKSLSEGRDIEHNANQFRATREHQSQDFYKLYNRLKNYSVELTEADDKKQFANDFINFIKSENQQAITYENSNHIKLYEDLMIHLDGNEHEEEKQSENGLDFHFMGK
ncbi:MAG: hypothetical protein ACE365_02770 [Gammaproteobacteria bacterium]